MKRLKLEAFKAQNIDKATQQATDKLLGQVLGDCHDDSSSNSGGSDDGCCTGGGTDRSNFIQMH